MERTLISLWIATVLTLKNYWCSSWEKFIILNSRTHLQPLTRFIKVKQKNSCYQSTRSTVCIIYQKYNYFYNYVVSLTLRTKWKSQKNIGTLMFTTTRNFCLSQRLDQYDQVIFLHPTSQNLGIWWFWPGIVTEPAWKKCCAVPVSCV